jgi:hypothetical protein
MQPCIAQRNNQIPNPDVEIRAAQGPLCAQAYGVEDNPARFPVVGSTFISGRIDPRQLHAGFEAHTVPFGRIGSQGEGPCFFWVIC